MSKERKEIRICDRHDEQVPLIWTFAFMGSEYWCPYCGGNFGMLGAGEMVPVTMDLKRSAVIWQKRSKEYLSALSSRACSSLLWEGKRISPDDLPVEEKKRITKVIEDWIYQSDVDNEQL